jgi:hypothetical protein
MKTFLVKLKITSNGQAFTALTRVKAESLKIARAKAQTLAADFFGQGSEVQRGGFIFDDGRQHVKVAMVLETTPAAARALMVI